MKPQDNSANMRNPNHGTPGTNKQRDQQEGNRGKQLNPLPNDANTPRKPAPVATPSSPLPNAPSKVPGGISGGRRGNRPPKK
jgi:hypothetical protein